MKKLLLCLFAVMAVAVPARAGNVSVTLDVSAAEPFAHHQIARCAISVAFDADGAQVLAAAKNAGCIESYELQTFSSGHFLNCINGVCGTPATYWRMTENGKLTAYGIDDFRAAVGDVLGFSYTVWVGCFVGEQYC